MRKWRLFTLGTTDVYLHPMLLLYIAYAVLTGHGMFMLLSLLSIGMHECAHAVCAAIFKKPPYSMEITPLGAVMRMEDEYSLSAGKRVVMLLAGPGMTLILCFSAVALTRMQLMTMSFGRLLFLCNVSVLLLNLMPALPLDGGRLVALFLGLVFRVSVVHIIMRWFSVLIGLGMIAANIYASWKLGSWNLSLTFAGCCMIYSSSISLTTRTMAELREFMDRKIRLERKGYIRISWIAANNYVSLASLIRTLPPGKMAVYMCIEPGSLKLIGQMTEFELVQHYMNRPEINLGDALNLSKCRKIFSKYDTI